jgi:GST-like protein
MMILYTAGPVGHSLKVMIAAAEKDLNIACRPLNVLGLEQHRDPLTSLTPTGSLPVLVNDTLVLTESSIINEYLDESQPGPALMPRTAAGRWRARTWFKFVNEDLAPAVSILAWREWGLPALPSSQKSALHVAVESIEALERRVHWQQALDGFPPAQHETADAKIATFLELVEKQLADSDHLAGAAFSLADIDALPFMEPLRRLRPALMAAHPRADAWIDRVRARPGVASAWSAYRDDRWVPGPELIRWG